MLRRNTVALAAWRDNGISYLKYLNVCTEALHMATTSKNRSKYLRYSTPGYITVKPDGSGVMEQVNKIPANPKDY